MAYIANTGFTVKGGKFKQTGKVFWDEVKKRACLYVTGVRLGETVIARPYAEDAPFLQGDLVAFAGKAGGKTRYQWCGRILSDVDGKGKEIYKITIEVMPTMLMTNYNLMPKLYIFNDDQDKEHDPFSDDTTERTEEAGDREVVGG